MQPERAALQKSGVEERMACTRLLVKFVPREHCSTQPAAVSYAHPSNTRRPSSSGKLLDAYMLP